MSETLIPPLSILPTPEMLAALERELRPGERALWRSRSRGGWRCAEWGGAVFGIALAVVGVAGLLGLLWLLIVLHFAGPAIGSLFLVPVLLVAIGIGAYSIRSPFSEMDRAGRSLFAVTNFRVLRIVVGPQTTSESAFHGVAQAESAGRTIGRSTVPPITCHERADGYGDVLILTGFGVVHNNYYPCYFRMLGIPGPERVAQLIAGQEPFMTLLRT